MQTTSSSTFSIRPMGWGLSILLFGIPTLALVIGTYVATPAMISLGMLPFYAQMIPGTIVNASLLGAAIYVYRVEGRTLTWAGLKERFRLHPLTGQMWLIAIGAGMVNFALYGVASGLGHWLIQKGWMPLPDSLPAWLDPRVTIPLVERFNRETGGLEGNWLLFGMALITFFFNIVGEEFWWRGYILPRQEPAFGKWVWLVHGLMWAFTHTFKWWDVIGLLPGCIFLSFIVWRFRNNTFGFVMHIITNVSFPAFVFLGVLGINL